MSPRVRSGNDRLSRRGDSARQPLLVRCLRATIATALDSLSPFDARSRLRLRPRHAAVPPPGQWPASSFARAPHHLLSRTAPAFLRRVAPSPAMAAATPQSEIRRSASAPSEPTWTGGSITSLRLYTRAPLYLRADTLPFAALYCAHAAIGALGRVSRFTFLAVLALLVTLHILAVLAQHWSVSVKAAFSWRRVRAFTPRRAADPAAPIHALVRPRVHRGKPELIRLETGSGGRVFFSFQKRTYEYNANEHRFDKVQYPTALPLSHYKTVARKSPMSDATIAMTTERYGSNRLEIPLPTFRELFQEALLAPFFVFQVFCIFLWMLDEHPFYSLMTLFMMLTFEATVVYSRLRSLRELRGMRNRPRTVNVYRNNKWVPVTSLDLLPNDILSVPRSSDPEEVVPCDLLILAGTAVVNEAMLTGESVPLMKEALADELDPEDVNRPLAMQTLDKNNIIFGGTRVLTHTPAPISPASPPTRPPDNGCVCFVLRTGFGSSQGTLMRTILYSTESVSANSWEAALFILFLLCFAIAASAYVLIHRYENDADSRYKLLLRCVLIVTSVVPPELPMQLSLAVNTSLVALAKGMVFCTEPFRIPYAGKVDVCGFDKTGTLTTDIIEAVGVALPPGSTPAAADAGEETCPEIMAGDEAAACSEYPMLPVARSSLDAAMVLATCHSLVYVDGGLIGDPLELASLSAAEWTYGSSGTSVPKRGGSSSVSCKIVQRYRFASALQRMSVIAEVRGNNVKDGARVLTKGSAEAIANLVGDDSLPDGYHETARALARRGMRVLALAFKDIPKGATASELLKMPRGTAESGLTFAGFICFECPLRSDSRRVIRVLKKSSHDVMMVTGDATLTAAHVARQVGISTRAVLILEKSVVTPGTLEWLSAATGKRRKKFAADKFPELAKDYDLCISGPALELAIELDPLVLIQLRHVKVFARTSPNQKEIVLTALKDAGLHTLFCGDGTNDVGALKQAHIGVALLSGSNTAAPDNARNPQGAASANGPRAHNGSTPAASSAAGASAPPASASRGGVRQRRKTPGNNQVANGGGPSNSIKTPQQLQREELSRRREESLNDSEDQAPLVKLGDASIASPFTSRRMTIESCITIIRQGRCTLATTSQMYQILALNCLISAYSLSVLYLEGVVFGDRQMTITSLAMAVSFFMISRSKPLKKLSPERPSSSVFAPQLFLSLLGQFAVHLVSLYYLTEIAREYVPYGPRNSIDAVFKPSVINTIIFLLSIAQQVNVFTVNYKGRPFMQGLTDNRMLLRSLLFVGGIVLVCTAELSPEINELMELTPWPNPTVQKQVAAFIAFDFLTAWLWDKLMWLLFAPKNRVIA